MVFRSWILSFLYDYLWRPLGSWDREPAGRGEEGGWSERQVLQLNIRIQEQKHSLIIFFLYVY